MKKNSNLLYLVILAITIHFISCTDKQGYTEQLSWIKGVIEEYPDSAFVILDSIIVFELNDKQINDYNLLYVQAKDKAYKDISSDTVIFQVKKYFLSKNDYDNLALAAYYCGRVFQMQNKNKESMNEYLEAEKYANNNNIKGLIHSGIGGLFQKQLLITNAIQHFFSAADYFNKSKNRRDEIATYNNIGNSYLMSSKNDSAFYYYDKGLKLAQQTNDSVQIASINLCKGVAYREIGKYAAAVEYFKKSDNYTTNNSYKTKISINLSKTFLIMGKLDSAKYYVQKSLSILNEDEDIFVKTNIYKTLSKIEEEEGNFRQSLVYYKDYSESLESIVNENKNKEILELQKKYKYEKYQNENNTLRLKQQRLLLIFSTLVIICCAIIFFFYRKSIQNKKIALAKENEILDAEKKIFQLLEMSKNYNHKEKNFRNMLLQHFDILKKAATLEKYVIGDNQQDYRLIKIFNEIVYGQDSLNWDLLYQDMNEIHNQLFDRLREKYPNLDETEYRICCLTYTGFSCSEIGIISALSPNTIQMKRSIIRKKLGIESQGSIQEYLDSKL